MKNYNTGIIGGIVVLVVLAVGVGIYSSKSDSSMIKKEDNAIKDKGETMATRAGSYESYRPEKIAMASSTHAVVLFFRASWCPTCIALDKDITSHLKDIPSNLTILDVDYDTSVSLKQKYGVTIQHTLVEVDAKGNLIKKWLGSPTLATLVSEVK
jgi:thioredoxin 1